MSPELWMLKNPHHLCMTITLHSDGTVTADFPLVKKCTGMAWDRDPWRAREKAILACAEAIVEQMRSEDESHIDSPS